MMVFGKRPTTTSAWDANCPRTGGRPHQYQYPCLAIAVLQTVLGPADIGLYGRGTHICNASDWL